MRDSSSATHFLAVVSEHQGIIHKVCRMYRDLPEDREDLYQEVVFQLWKAFPSFRGEAKVSSWMYRIALNTAMAAFRKQRPAVDLPGEVPDFATEPNQEANLEEERLFAALRTLNDAEKSVVSLYLEGFAYQEIADITGLTENAVGIRLTRIKAKLKEKLSNG